MIGKQQSEPSKRDIISGVTRGGLDQPQTLHPNELEQRMSVVLGQMNEHLRALPELEVDYSHIQQALDDFHAFFGQYHSYFQRHVYEGHNKHPEMTNEYVLKTALANTIETWEMLTRAISQRFNPVYRDALQEADEYALSLMERSASLFDFDDHQQTDEKSMKPIIYFEKFFHITRFLYRSHPLIAIPLDRSRLLGEENERGESGATLVQDEYWAAISHELGHYVFWNSGSLVESHKRMDELRQKITLLIQTELQNTVSKPTFHLDKAQQKINEKIEEVYTWLGWLEEAFADVFGTLLLGGIYAKSAQDLIVREVIATPSDLFHDDGEHPMPYLRPLIATETLQLMAQKAEKEKIEVAPQLKELASKLEQRWREYLEKMSKHKHDNEDKLSPSIDEHHHSHDHLHKDENVVERAEALITYIKPIVEIILSHQMFKKEGKKERLIDYVEYWGKNEKTKEQIVPCSEAVKKNSLISQEEEMRFGVNSTDKKAFEIPSKDEIQPNYLHLADLFEYMKVLSEEEKETGLSEPWEALLHLPLSMQARHTNPQAHDHNTLHKHTYNSIKVLRFLG